MELREGAVCGIVHEECDVRGAFDVVYLIMNHGKHGGEPIPGFIFAATRSRDRRYDVMSSSRVCNFQLSAQFLFILLPAFLPNCYYNSNNLQHPYMASLRIPRLTAAG